MILHPSLASADPLRYAEALTALHDAPLGSLHLDIEDTSFINNITFGMKTIQAVAQHTRHPLSLHLMVSSPQRWLPWLAAIRPGWIFIHAESVQNPSEILADIRAIGAKAGLALNPATPLLSYRYLALQLDALMIMTSEPDRIKQMLHYLWQHRHLSTQQAIELFGYAEATVRRDFHYIASRYPGMVRGHGCIDFDDSTEDKEYVFDVKRTLQSEAKREIAALARTFIKDGDCFFLDSGSTCLELAKCLVDAKVKVICNDIKIANELGGFPHVESYIIGGLIRPGYFSVGESLALEMINAFAVERAFISCDALSIETGITNATMFEVGVKTRIIQRSREVILMADHSKFDTVEPHAVATLSCITTILSDSALPSAIARRYQQAGCRLIMPDPSSGAR